MTYDFVVNSLFRAQRCESDFGELATIVCIHLVRSGYLQAEAFTNSIGKLLKRG